MVGDNGDIVRWCGQRGQLIKAVEGLQERGERKDRHDRVKGVSPDPPLRSILGGSARLGLSAFARLLSEIREGLVIRSTRQAFRICMGADGRRSQRNETTPNEERDPTTSPEIKQKTAYT
jgi:hypothetical protein